MKISLITVSYNSEKTIANTIVSVANQSHKNTEHIVVDGASTDRTVSIVRQFSDIPITLISERDNGIYDAMNKGINLSSGEIVGILNADDFYPHNNILGKVNAVFSDSDVDACYGDLRYVDPYNLEKTLRLWRSGKYDVNKFFHGWMPPHPTFFVRRHIYEHFGVFNLEMGSAADYEIILRFLLRNKINVEYIPDILVHMRQGGVSNSSIINRLKANYYDRKAWQVNNLTPFPWTLWMKPLRKISQWL